MVGSRGDAFSTLARAIVGQQISVKAAQSVWQRLVTELAEMSPASVCAADATRLRTCGLSGQKAAYLTDLAQRFSSGALDPTRWHALDDEALITELTQVKGIGRWTAEMFLIFYMARPDVLPLDDIGLQRAMSLHYNTGRPLSKLKMRRIGKGWAPWRSVATWYLWRSLDPLPVGA
jgi:DNA-3-methyladenine glycosylase II